MRVTPILLLMIGFFWAPPVIAQANFTGHGALMTNPNHARRVLDLFLAEKPAS